MKQFIGFTLATWALVCVLAGAALALHHPLWPAAMLAMLWLFVVVEAWRPGAWLFWAPACLPLLNFSPWTGWFAFEEFDILLLGFLAGGYARLAWAKGSQAAAPAVRQRLGVTTALVVMLAASGLWALQRGLQDAGGWAWDWFGGYATPMNSVRVFKSLLFAVLFYPLLRRQLGTAPLQSERNFCMGMVAGLSVVVLAVVWERMGFVGLLNFSSHYRTVGLFWEMHVGGAAIDAYLAMAAPFAAWALLTARRPAVWLAAATLLTLTVYACLTTFSRGVYLATLGPAVLLPWLIRRSLPTGATLLMPGWRANGVKVLLVLMVVEVAGVLGGGSFMGERINATGRDMDGRFAHWQRGLELLGKRPDQLLGIGVGRLPANYAAAVPQEGFPGKVTWCCETGNGNGNGNDSGAQEFVTLRTPDNLDNIDGVWALTQRVNLQHPGPYRLQMKVRANADVQVTAELCERHLLYDRICQGANLTIAASTGAWQSVVAELLGLPIPRGPWYAPRLKMLSLSVGSPGSAVDLDKVTLTDGMGNQLLLNGDFSKGLASWFPAARYHFLPWHIDNLYLETLIERGLLGVLPVGLLVVAALWTGASGRMHHSAFSPFGLSGLIGVLVVGLVSSMMDVPRVAFLYYLLILLFVSSKPRLANENV